MGKRGQHWKGGGTLSTETRGLEKVTFRSFLNEEEAPEGYVFKWDSTPFLQVHFYENKYVAFWLGKVTKNDILDAFFYAKQRVERRLSESDEDNPKLWEVNVTCSYPKDRQEHYTWQLPFDEMVSRHTIEKTRKEIGEKIYEEERAWDFDISASLLPRKYWHFSLWGDSAESDQLEKEVGVTSNLPLSVPILAFFKLTSAIRNSQPEGEKVIETLAHFKAIQASLKTYTGRFYRNELRL